MNWLKKFLSPSPAQETPPPERPQPAASEAAVKERAKPVVDPDWDEFLATDPDLWKRAREKAATGPKILIATSTGGHGAVTPLESLLAVALTLRGANVHFLLCDHFLPGCLQMTVIQYEPRERFLEDEALKAKLCKSCFGKGSAIYERTGLPIHRFSELVEDEEKALAKELSLTVPRDEISRFRWHDYAVGDHANAAALRFMGSGSFTDDPYEDEVLRKYLEAAILSATATARLLKQERFSVACFHHGIYVPLGIIGEVARQQRVRVANWAVAYRKGCFVFSHDNSYHHTMIDEPVGLWENIDWSPAHNAVIADYLRSRWTSSNDWIKFFDEPEIDPVRISNELGLDPGKPCVAMLTNVTWDAQLFYASNAFPSILDWVFRTIEWFSRNPELQLIVRIHPAEVRGTMKTRQPLQAEIAKRFPDLPGNIFIVAPESSLSTYAIAAISDCALIYGTKTGVELTAAGIPVIVAGEAWIRNKGITMDAASEKDYFETLATLPLKKRLDPEIVERARKYAFHFFYRRMIPLQKSVEQVEGFPLYRIRPAPLSSLLPGNDEGLDVICEGILSGSPFIYPAEKQVSDAH